MGPSCVGSFTHMGSLTCDPSQMGSRTHMGSARVGTFPPGIPHMGSFSKKRGNSPTGLLLTRDLILTWDLNGINARDPPHVGPSKHGILPGWDVIACGAYHMGPPHTRVSPMGPSCPTQPWVTTWCPTHKNKLTLEPLYMSREPNFSTQLNSTQLCSTPCARSTEGVIPPLVEASATRGTLSLVSQAAVGGTLG